MQSPVEGVSKFVTPNSDFYRIDTALSVPQVPAESWRLKVHGMVDRELEIDFEDLLRRRAIERDITLTCVSNEVGGKLVGNARWLGVPLADILEEAGVQPGADQLKSTSVDGWTSGTPVAAIMDGRDAMLAYAMNGEPLPTEHGFPVRMVVPGLYGFVSATKWVVDLELTTFDDVRRVLGPARLGAAGADQDAVADRRAEAARARRRPVQSASAASRGRSTAASAPSKCASTKATWQPAELADRAHDRHVATVVVHVGRDARQPQDRSARRPTRTETSSPRNASHPFPTARPDGTPSSCASADPANSPQQKERAQCSAKPRKRLAAGLVVALALTAAACGGDDDDDSASSSDTTVAQSTTTEGMTDTTEAMSDAPFGAACAQVPTTGEGSVDGMADDPVATAASNNPLLSTLVSAVTAANLGDTLNSADDITVFAPANSAFEAMDKATLDAAMADPSGLLTTVLTYHVVPGRLEPGRPGRRARDAPR